MLIHFAKFLLGLTNIEKLYGVFSELQAKKLKELSLNLSQMDKLKFDSDDEFLRR